MLLVIRVMNPDIPFSVFEGFVENSIGVAIGLTIALIVHYIAHNRYLASKWQQYEKQQGAYNSDSQISDEEHDFSHLKVHYKEVDEYSEEDPIELKNGNHI